MDNQEKTSRSSSKENLNESSRPLLDEEEARAGVVAIEMNQPPVDPEEKTDADGKGSDAKKNKEEKTKKPKKEKQKTNKITFIDQLTAGLNILDRDDKNVNDHINIAFEDVLAEPDSNHTFVCVWQNSFLLFDVVKFWFYRILSAILFIPFAFLWGLIFAILTCLNVWVVSPLLRTFDVVLHIVHRIWSGIIRTFLDPVFKSIGQICSNVHVTSRRSDPQA
ncbi:caveolin-1 [Trichonephila inaurata madagascariensis]|uniref:Caveolin n=1 Tax=Trichonephila inaurata madagascariensis TaxID=2747483 RepID=A0A8X7CN53_9ARAC|nr:caveolin-1 [Trichonephila inaurata madagascariensis]